MGNGDGLGAGARNGDGVGVGVGSTATTAATGTGSKTGSARRWRRPQRATAAEGAGDISGGGSRNVIHAGGACTAEIALVASQVDGVRAPSGLRANQELGPAVS